MSRSRVQEIECVVDHWWAALYRAVATKMLDYLDRRESLEVDIEELVSSKEPNVEVRHMALHARQGGHDIKVASAVRWEEHERMFIIHEEKCQELCQAIEQMGKREELLATVTERKKSLQQEA